MCRNFRHTIVAAILLMFPISSNAAAYCSEPSTSSSPPSGPGSYSKPSAPYCMANYSYTREHTCDSWEIDSYIDEVNEYIRKLNDFSNEAQDYANEAINFANEAAEYARCEANDVKSEMQ